MDRLGSADILLFQGFRLDRSGGGLFRLDQTDIAAPVALGSRALDLLGLLAERQGELVSKDTIMEAVWPGMVVEEGNLTVHISALRRILDQHREECSCIQTVPGRGYRFVAPVRRVEPDARLAPRLSIVVLPFTNLSDDREQQYFADGITEDLTTDLSRIENMFVISRNTAFTYRNKPVETKQIGRELGVHYVLEGSVRRSGNQLRVSAQLIDAETDAHLWAERFDREMADLFVLQNEFTGGIANTLYIELVAAEAARPTDNPDALDYIFRGRAVTLKPLSRNVYAEAISMYERALALDPRSAEAQSLLADALAHRVLVGVTDSAADIARAEELIDRALAASPRYPLAHFAKGQLLRAQGRCEEAIPEYETVLAINRNAANVLNTLADCKLLTGSIEEVILLEEQAIRLSPRDPLIGHFYFRIGHVHLLQSRLGEAILWLERARNAVPEFPFVHLVLASAYGLQGETERAAAELAEARRLHGGDRYSNIARQKAFSWRMAGAPNIRALLEATYLVGLRKAGMPEE